MRDNITGLVTNKDTGGRDLDILTFQNIEHVKWRHKKRQMPKS